MLNLGLTGTIHLAIEPVDGRYLADAHFSIDNNVAERAVRPLAIGRNDAQLRMMRS
jgi:hypothetical protein